MATRKSLPIIFSLLDTPAFGGAEQYIVGHLKYLAALGYPIVLATNNPTVAEEVRKRVDPRQYPQFAIVRAPYLLDAIGNWKGLTKYFASLPWACSWFVWKLWQLRRQSDAGVVCLFLGFSDRLTFSPFVHLPSLRSPVIWIEIGPLEPTFKKNWDFPQLLYQFTRWSADSFVTTSKFTLESMVRTGQISRSNITLVYPGVTPFSAERITKFRAIGRQEKKRRGLDGKKIVTFVGRLASENEVELVIEAVATLGDKSVKLLIIGDGPERNRFEARAKQLGIASQTHFTGFVSEETKYGLLAVSDVFTFTRAWELDGFGMTTIEAMSLGVPVITSNFGPQIEIVQNHQSGLLFKPHDSADLAKKICELLTNPALRKKIGTAGKKRVAFFDEKKYWQKMASVVNAAHG
jgi:glycosyltransferase involved in cell wall biosynthesis